MINKNYLDQLMMFDKNYLDHELILNSDVPNIRDYICIKCKINLFLAGSGKFYLLEAGHALGNPILQCDEFIIKSIIE